MAGWLASWLAGWLTGWMVGWLTGPPAGWLAGWLTGWLAGCWAGWLPPEIWIWQVLWQSCSFGEFRTCFRAGDSIFFFPGSGCLGDSFFFRGLVVFARLSLQIDSRAPTFRPEARATLASFLDPGSWPGRLLAGRLLVGWLAGWLDGWPAGRPAGRLAWLAWLTGWLTGWLAGSLDSPETT